MSVSPHVLLHECGPASTGTKIPHVGADHCGVMSCRPQRSVIFAGSANVPARDADDVLTSPGSRGPVLPMTTGSCACTERLAAAKYS